ncbi:MAG: cytochrome d ubiquinol oxidase subunit II [Nocardioidaceae bacterium]
MDLSTVWYVLLGLLLGGYFVLGGFDYGVQMLTAVFGRGDERQRRVLLGAVGPFFLGNEVWLVAVAGVLFGAFPFLEGTLLAGFYPVVVVLVLALVVGKTAVQLRSRYRSRAARRSWDLLIALGGLVPALAWGVMIGLLLQGVPLDADSQIALSGGDVANPFVVTAALAVASVFLLHGAAFLAMRLRGDGQARAEALLARLRPVVLVLIIAAVVAGLGSSDVRTTIGQPALAVVLVAGLLVAVGGAPTLVQRTAAWKAFAMTSAAVVLPVLLVGVGLFPLVLVSTLDPALSMSVGEGAADPATLEVLGWFALVLLPVIGCYQAFSWWLFRGRVSRPSYF